MVRHCPVCQGPSLPELQYKKMQMGQYLSGVKNHDGTMSIAAKSPQNASGKPVAGVPGSLPAGTQIQKNADGTISVGGKKLPPGASIQTNADGTVSIQGDIP